MNTSVKTRFAPSPTGLMHFGSLRTAFFNYLYAKHMGGSFLLRIEDTDASRSEKQYSEAILADMAWIGLEWQEGPYYQSERQAIYDKYYQILKTNGRVYPCFCTEEQLAITRKIQLSRGQPPRYPGTCRQLSQEEVDRKVSQGMPFALRFEVPKAQIVEFHDLIKGMQRFETDHIGDFIIRRNDGSASFMFCNAIDDSLMGITHALRGDDHLTNTPRQILILQALGLPIVRYGHFPTILGPDSRKLSKRNGSRSIQELRTEGYLPFGILNYLSRLGHFDADSQFLDPATLCAHFNLEHISHAPAHYDAAQLNHWQKEAMHRLSKEACWQILMPYVAEWVPEDRTLAFVECVQPNLIMPSDALVWAKAIFAETLSYSEEILNTIRNAKFLFFQTAMQLLNEPGMTFQLLVNRLQQATGKKGREIFFPLRAALTGELHGPELAKMLDLMGNEKAQIRLAKAASYADL